MVRYSVTIGGEKRIVELEERDGQLAVTVDGVARSASRSARPAPGRYSWIEGTRVVSAEVEKAGDKLAVTLRGETVTVEVADARLEELPVLAPAGARQQRGRARCGPPWPGGWSRCWPGRATRSRRAGRAGDRGDEDGERGARPRDGRVREVRVAEGAAVDGGEELAVIE